MYHINPRLGVTKHAIITNYLTIVFYLRQQQLQQQQQQQQLLCKENKVSKSKVYYLTDVVIALSDESLMTDSFHISFYG